MFKFRILGLSLLLALPAACGNGGGGDGDDGVDIDAPAGDVPVLAGPSRSSTIAISGDDRRVLMVNPEAGTVSLFDATTNLGIAEIATGGEPSAVVFHPDDRTAFVANKRDATVVKLSGLDGTTPTVSAPLAVGSEPTGLALSPTGARLYVAEWAEGRIAVIDTELMDEVGAITAPQHPRGVSVTNDGDQDDNDELIIVPEFFGEPVGDEATDTSRNGRVRIYSTSDLQSGVPIVFAPIDSTFAPSTAPAGSPTVMASPNQLWTAAVVGNKIYVPTISASPAPPTNFQTNVQPVLLVGDLATRTEDRGRFGTLDLAAMVRDQVPEPTAENPAIPPRFFLADIVDVDFVGTDVAYVLSRGADVIQRVVYQGAAPSLGSPQNKQIDLNRTPPESPGACLNPTGIVIGHASPIAYVNCWGSRRLGVVDLSKQELTRTITSSTITDQDGQDGLHFFFTGRGRWSRNAWSSCGSCHPDGLSDNITWSFGTGPRQSTALDGTYGRGNGAPKQRILNWTGERDEMHDFERNTRAIQGGLGAVTQPKIGGACVSTGGTLDQEEPVVISFADDLGRAVRLDQSCNRDWDKIDAYAQRLVRPPVGLRRLDDASVARGAALFGEPTVGASNAGCVRCHGGRGWTASRRAFTPGADEVSPETARVFTPPALWPQGPPAGSQGWNFHTRQIDFQPASPFFAGLFEATNRIAPNQVACVLRNVSTFGSDELERRLLNGTLARARGKLGFNVPSLYGMSLGAPYLHHGGATDLQDLMDDPAWQAHLTAGNPIWLSQAGGPAEVAQKKADLINYLLTIDATTPEQAIPAGFDGCP